VVAWISLADWLQASQQISQIEAHDKPQDFRPSTKVPQATWTD
jgi:hypothetical protein